MATTEICERGERAMTQGSRSQLAGAALPCLREESIVTALSVHFKNCFDTQEPPRNRFVHTQYFGYRQGYKWEQNPLQIGFLPAAGRGEARTAIASITNTATFLKMRNTDISCLLSVVVDPYVYLKPACVSFAAASQSFLSQRATSPKTPEPQVHSEGFPDVGKPAATSNPHCAFRSLQRGR